MTEKMNLQRGEARIRNSDAHGFEKEEGPAESSSNGHRLERVEVPPNKAKVWHSFETNMMQQLDAVKQDVQQRCGPNSKPVLFVEYLQHLLMLLAPNVRKVTTTLYDSESTAETIKSFFQPLDPKPLMDLKKQNEALLEGMKFRLSKHAAFQAKTVSDSEKQAKVLYSNTLLQIGGEMAAVTDLTGSSCAFQMCVSQCVCHSVCVTVCVSQCVRHCVCVTVCWTRWCPERSDNSPQHQVEED